MNYLNALPTLEMTEITPNNILVGLGVIIIGISIVNVIINAIFKKKKKERKDKNENQENS